MRLSFILKQALKEIPMPFYAVARGRNVGVFTDWKSCEQQVKGFPNSNYKKFDLRKKALEFIEQNKVKEDQPTSSTNLAPQKVGRKRKLNDSAEANLFAPAKMKLLETGLKELSDIDGDHGPIVYTDGACSNNGNKLATAGYGVFWGDDHEDNLSARLEGVPTNNRAEYMAIICALEKAIERGHTKLTVRTDSQLIIKSMTIWLEGWRKNNWKRGGSKGKSEVLNLDLIQRLDSLLKKIPTKFEHVRGHFGIHGNEMADELARQGCLLPFAEKQEEK